MAVVAEVSWRQGRVRRTRRAGAMPAGAERTLGCRVSTVASRDRACTTCAHDARLGPDGRPSTNPRCIFVSMAMRSHSPPLAMALVRNMLRFVLPERAAVHLSRGAATVRERSASLAALARFGKVLINPVALRMTNNLQILAAHLANVRLLDARLPLHSEDLMVFAAANQVFYRPCSPFLANHSLSFGSGVGRWAKNEDVDIRFYGGSQGEFHQEQFRGPVSFPSKPWASMMAAFVADATRRGRLPTSHSSFAQLFKAARPVGWSAAPLAMQPHEGTYYPIGLLRDFIEKLRTTPFSQAKIMRDTRCPLPANWCVLPREPLLPHTNATNAEQGPGGQRRPIHMDALRRACAAPAGACTIAFEEVLLPSFLAQFHAERAFRQGSPPLVSRVWGTNHANGLSVSHLAPLLPKGGKESMRSWVAALFAYLREPRFIEQRPQACGVKVPTPAMAVRDRDKSCATDKSEGCDALRGYDALLWQMLEAAHATKTSHRTAWSSDVAHGLVRAGT